jgi:hypothetical protein
VCSAIPELDITTEDNPNLQAWFHNRNFIIARSGTAPRLRSLLSSPPAEGRQPRANF